MRRASKSIIGARDILEVATPPRSDLEIASSASGRSTMRPRKRADPTLACSRVRPLHVRSNFTVRKTFRFPNQSGGFLLDAYFRNKVFNPW